MLVIFSPFDRDLFRGVLCAMFLLLVMRIAGLSKEELCCWVRLLALIFLGRNTRQVQLQRRIVHGGQALSSLFLQKRDVG